MLLRYKSVQILLKKREAYTKLPALLLLALAPDRLSEKVFINFPNLFSNYFYNNNLIKYSK